MLEYIFSLSLLIVAAILIRGICKKRVSGKLVYALWLAVILRLIVPVNLISIDMPFPEISELVAVSPEAPISESAGQSVIESTERMQSINEIIFLSILKILFLRSFF